MEIIEVPEEHVLLQLSSIEIRALLKTFANVRNSMDPESFTGYVDLPPKFADELARKLGDALAIARRRRA